MISFASVMKSNALTCVRL